MADSRGILVAQRYRLVRVIGAGGMGRVWLGHDELIDREVAIKQLLLPPGLDDEQRSVLSQRAIREARSAGRLNHPGIVTVHDVVEYDGAPMIVMELVRGGSLSDAIQAQGGLPVERVAHIGLAMLDALRVAHRAEIVHRDLKPANVLLAEDRVVITDFGIAKLMGDVQLTMSGTIVGSPAYIAPEQVNGAPSTPASDLYSLGATLYTAVEGRPPFEGPDVMATLAALLTRDPEPPVRAGRLTGLLTAMLRKDPAQRPTADQIAHVLAGGGADAETFRAPAAMYPEAMQPAAMYPAGAPFMPPTSDSRHGRGGVQRRTMLLAGGGAVAAIGIGASVWYFGSKGTDDPATGNAANSSPQHPTREQSNGANESNSAGPGNSAEPGGKPVEITDHVQLAGHERGVSSVVFSPDGKLLASCDGDLSNEGPIALLWDMASGKQVAKLIGPTGPGGASVVTVAFSPDGKLLAAGGLHLDDTALLWIVADRKLIGPLADSGSIMKSMAFSPDGKIVAGMTTRGTVTLWDVASRQVKIGLPDGNGFRNVTFSPDGKLLANSGRLADIRLSEVSTGRTVHTLTDGTGDSVTFSPDGKTLAAADADGTNSIRLWDVATGRSKEAFPRTEEIVLTSVLYSPDGKTLAAWGLGNVIQLWDVASGRVRAVLLGASGKVNTVVFDPAGTRIASGGDDKTIRIWTLAR